MASSASTLALEPDQFAFLFRGDQGIGADELGNFLQRVATVARRNGAELRVVVVDHGSLVVVMKAVARSAKKEFFKAPVATTASGVTIVSVVVGAIVYAASAASGPAPLAKAGADLVEAKSVKEIQIVTVNQTIIIMDEGRAKEVRKREAERETLGIDRPAVARPSPAEVRKLVDRARDGSLTGEVHEAAGELVFRPTGFRYFVPIQLDSSAATEQLKAGHGYSVKAEIQTNRGQPDYIIIHEAKPI